MDEYIKREAARCAIEKQCVDGKMWGNAELTLIDVYDAIEAIDEIRTADVAPVVHGRWIPVSERLPKPENEVMIVCNRNGRRFIATAIHEDGTLFEGDSDWRWNDIDEYGCYDEERDDYIIPEGWWESRCFTPDDVYNCPVDCEVTHWMPMPELPKMAQEVSK